MRRSPDATARFKLAVSGEIEALDDATRRGATVTESPAEGAVDVDAARWFPMTFSDGPADRDDRDSVTHAYDGDALASHAVIGALADLEGVTPATVHTDLGITLYESIDPERLDALIESGDGSGDVAIEFEIDADVTYAVEVVDGDSVTVARKP